MDYLAFNFYEAVFWISLGGILLIVHQIAHWQARAIFIEAAIWTTLFGLSDIVEMATDGLFRTDLWWLVLWKAVCIGGIIHIIYRYLHLRAVIK